MPQDGSSESKIEGNYSWVTPEIRERRSKAAAPYVVGHLEALHEQGKIVLQPRGERVLLRAILASDVSDLSLDSYDARQSIAHEVVAIGLGVAGWERAHGVAEGHGLRVGQHCFVLSQAADRLSKTDKSVRLWLAHVDDISASWDVSG